MSALLRDGATEVLCEHPQCFAHRPPEYSTDRPHAYVQRCLWRAEHAALHLMAAGTIHLADRRSGLVTFAHPLAWSHAIQLVRVDADHGVVGLAFDDHRIRASAGPYPIEEAEALADALDYVTTPRRAVRVTAQQLAAAPAEHDGELVITEGTWDAEFEGNNFERIAWSTLPSRRGGRATVIGLWLADPARRYGHLGGWRAELLVIEER